MNRPSIFIWRPATTYVLIGGFVAVLIGIVGAYIANSFSFEPTRQTHIGSNVYQLQVADTEELRQKGLSGVEALNRNGGLLMAFDSDDTWGIWMKDMEIPIDILWLDKNKKIIHLVKEADPELSTDVIYTPDDAARYVIELQAGQIKKAGIRKGMPVHFEDYNDGQEK